MVIVAELQLLPDSNIQRSRRLSSTRGLNPKKDTKTRSSAIRRELQLKRDVGEKATSDDNDFGVKAQHINWEFNEKVSLSSGSSTGIKIRPGKDKGIEFRAKNPKPSLDLMNVSASTPDMAKHDSRKTEMPNPRNWLQAKQKIDKTNEAISKRLDLIHELNQKILVNYERFQQKSWKGHAKGLQDIKKMGPNSLRRKTPKDLQKVEANSNFSLSAKPHFAKNRDGKVNITRISVNYRDQDNRRSDSCDLYRGKDIYFQKEDIKSFGKKVHQECASGQEALEKKILRDFNETIERYDTEVKGDVFEDDDSFSVDSIRSSTPVVGRGETGKRSAKELNSSWDDSGVGVEGGVGSGWVRVHMGIESSLVYLTLDTTTRDVCRDMLLTEELSIFVQVGFSYLKTYENGSKLCRNVL